MIKQSVVSKYRVICDNCGKQVIKEKRKEKEVSMGNSKTDMMYPSYMMPQTEITNTDRIIPGDWFIMSSQQIVCGEKCIIELNAKNSKHFENSNLEEYRKQQLHKLRK